jgi:hypothetical protein
MGTNVLRRVAAVIGFSLTASAAWGIDPVPNSLQAAGYPAGLPASPIKDLTPTEFLTQPGHEVGGGHADLIPHEEHQAESGLYGTFEYLLLRPRRENLNYALVSNTTAPTPMGQTESLNFDRNSGVRAAVGYRLPENWDATFAYTYFRSSAEGATAAPPGGILYPTLTRPGFVDSAIVGSANAGYLQNLYDAEFGRRFELGETCSARVFGGFRFADIKTDFSASYDGRDAAGSLVSTRNEFQGFGPMVGAEGAISVWRKFQIYARASGGLLTGSSTAGLTETNQNGQSVYASYDSTTRKVVPTCTVGIGAGWQAGRLSVRAGYEITYWGSLIDTTRLSSDFSPGKTTTTSESLSLEGFFFRLGWEF